MLQHKIDTKCDKPYSFLFLFVRTKKIKIAHENIVSEIFMKNWENFDSTNLLIKSENI
jgi:hypothetical protein